MAPPAAKEPSSALVSEVPRAPYGLVPAELADEGVLERMRHRTLLRRWTSATLHRDDRRTAVEMRHEQEADEVLPVIDEVPHALRVVIESDNARYAAWISRADVAPTVLAPTLLGTLGANKSAEGSGVWLEPGARLSVSGASRETRQVHVLDDLLAIEGLVPAARVGTVWVVPPGGSLASDMERGQAKSWELPGDRGPHVRLAARAVVRGHPSTDGALLATIQDAELVAIQVASRDGWTEVEVIRPHVRVRGFVSDAAVRGPAGSWGGGSIGLGRVSSGSHARLYQLDAGTCLYDRKDGEVVGVQLAPRQRLGGANNEGWTPVYVDTPWAIAHMYVKNVATDPGGDAVWDTCTQRPHR